MLKIGRYGIALGPVLWFQTKVPTRVWHFLCFWFIKGSLIRSGPCLNSPITSVSFATITILFPKGDKNSVSGQTQRCR